jgi:ribosome-associated protein
VVLLDLRDLGSFADYFVIATSSSERQMRALVEAVDSAADGHRTHPRWEGRNEDGWRLADLSDVIVHLFSIEQRARYDLDGLWQRAQEVVHIQ